MPQGRNREGPAGTSLSDARLIEWLLGGLVAIATLWLLRAAAVVTLPLAFALFIALAVLPVREAVARRVGARLKWLGYAAAIAVVLAFLLLFMGGIILAAQQVAGSAEQLLPRLQQQLARLSILGLGGGGQAFSQLANGVTSYARSLAAGAGNTAAGLVLILFLILLMLSEADAWRSKIAAVSSEKGRGWADA